MIEDEEEFIEHIKKQKYMVIFPDKSCKMYENIRDVAKDTSIDHSTIFKKLKNDVHTFCYAKGSDYIFYIRKISKLS